MVKVLVTGDRGFIAARLTERLAALGHAVTGYDLRDGRDLLDLATLEPEVAAADVVFHVAAQSDLTLMAVSAEAGHRGVADNVVATSNVAFACARHGKWLIFASTVCVYGNSGLAAEDEDTSLPNPAELYACSKYAAELIVRGYGLSYGMPWTSLRFATVFGPGMRKSLGVYVFFAQAMRGVPITVHGDGSQTRTLTYVDDLIEGMAACLARPAAAQGQTFNLTAGSPVSALRMAEDIRRIAGSSSPIVFVAQRRNQTLHERPTTEKASRLLGWRAQTGWEEGLQRSHAWLRGLAEL